QAPYPLYFQLFYTYLTIHHLLNKFYLRKATYSPLNRSRFLPIPYSILIPTINIDFPLTQRPIALSLLNSCLSHPSSLVYSPSKTLCYHQPQQCLHWTASYLSTYNSPSLGV
ncbi:hypothetical protein A6R68_05562, partial [Neotoma lepida]